MIASAATWCARIIAALAGVVLAFAAALYADSGEGIGPYIAMVPLWIGAYVVTDRWLSRRSAGIVPVAGRLTLALTGAALSALSMRMAVRYAMTPETLRRLDRATRCESVRVPGGLLAYYSTNRPELPRLVFVHGTPGHAGVWADYLLDPVPGFESVAVDRLGFGRSTGSGPVPSFEEQARAIAMLLVERDGHWPILVGHSLGGPIVARIAADYPERVRGIVILAGSLDPELETPSWYNEVTSLPPIDLKMPELYDTSNAEIAGAREQTKLLSGVLDRIRCPVEVVHGTTDKLVPVANVAFVKKSMVNSRRLNVTLIEGEGHAVHNRRTDVCAAIARVMVLGG